jgi:hypothetical protein
MHNFAVFPLALLSDKASKHLKTYHYEDDQVDPRTGRLLRRKVTLTSADAFGLPTASDEEVFLGLVYLTVLADFPADRRVHFSRHQLLQLVGWKPTTENYRRLKLSLSRWKGVSILYENWWDADAQQPATKGFGILDNFDLYDDRRRGSAADCQAELPLSHVTWNEIPYGSFRYGRKDLDLQLFFQLPTAAAKRAYRYLDRDLPPGDEPRAYDLHSFACEHIGLSRSYKPSRLLKEVQEDVVEPLESADFIVRFKNWKQRYRSQGRSGYQVIFARKPTDGDSLPVPPEQTTAPSPEAAPEPSAVAVLPSPLLQELKRHGIGGKAARDFIAAHPAAYIEAKIDYLDFLIETGERPNRPAGWLRRAIEEDFGPPASYVPKPERESRRRVAEEARQQKQREDEDRRRRQQEEEHKLQRERADRAYALAIFGRLPEAEQHAIEAAAVADGDGEFQSLRQHAREHRRSAAWDIVITGEVLKRYPMPDPQT